MRRQPPTDHDHGLAGRVFAGASRPMVCDAVAPPSPAGGRCGRCRVTGHGNASVCGLVCKMVKDGEPGCRREKAPPPPPKRGGGGGGGGGGGRNTGGGGEGSVLMTRQSLPLS